MWDWRWPITDIRKEVREARTNGESTTSLDKLEHLLDDLTDTYQRLEEEDSKTPDAEGEYSAQMEHWEKYVTFLYDKASYYNTVIIAASFVAFFAVWSALKDHTLTVLYVWSAAFVLVSLIVFVVWEVGLSVYTASSIRNEAKLFEKSGKEYQKLKDDKEKKERKSKLSIIPFWYIVLIITIGCGLAGGLLLLLGIIMGPTLNGV